MGTIRVALDSDDLGSLFHPVDIIMTYSDLVHDRVAFEAEHKGKTVVYIDRKAGDPDGKASIVDVEPGCYAPFEVAAWYDHKAAAKVPYLTHYSDRNDLPAITAGIGGRHMWKWVATLDGTVGINGFVPLQAPDIVQCLPAAKVGIHADLSLVLSPSWHPASIDAQVAAAQAAAAMVGRDINSAAAALASLRAHLSQA